MRSLVWLAAAAAACGSVNKQKPDAQVIDAAIDAPPDPQNGAKSGTRIKLQWFVFDDGTKQFSAFHDAQLGATCYPRSFSGDTHQYCIPQYTNVYFSDAACTQKIALVYQNPCPTQQYTYQFAAETQSMNCIYGVTHLYHLGAPTTVANYYYKDSGGTCQNGGAPPTSEMVYSLGAEVTTSGLAEITMSTPAPGTLGVISLQSADGMSFPTQLHDTTGGFDCRPNYNYYGATSASCFPTHTVYAGYYSDAACMNNTMQVQMGCTAQPYMYKPTKNQCVLDAYEIHQTGGQTTPQPTNYYQWNTSSQTCNAATPQTGVTFYDMGAQVTLQTLMRTRETLPGHRMQGVQFTAGDTRLRDYVLYDSTLDAECYIQQMGDGTYRCVSSDAYIDRNTTYYSDAGCSMPIMLAQMYKGASASCASPPAPHYAYDNVMVGQCYDYEIFQVGAKYTGTVYYSNGTCQVYPSSAQVDWYQVGPQVPLVGLAPATLQNDP